MDIQEQINELKLKDTPESQVQLGCLYSQGPASVRNYDVALDYFNKAAQAGNTDAMFHLGLLYHLAVGVKKDFGLVEKYARQALDLGDGKACYLLYVCNKFFGVFGLTDSEMEQIALKGKDLLSEHVLEHPDDVDALYVLGCFYSMGPENIRDYSLAISCFNQGCKLDNCASIVQMAKLYDLGLGVRKSKGNAQKMLDKAIELDCEQAMFMVGQNYLESGSPKDLKKAAKLFERACGLGHALAMVELATLYESGKGVQKDISKALKLLNRAVELNEPGAMLLLSTFYLHGKHVPQDVNKAISLLEQAVELGSSVACNNLGMMYITGYQGVNQDLNKGKELLEKASALGFSGALVNLAQMYENQGQLDKAKQLCLQAIDLNNPEAMLYMATHYYGVTANTPPDKQAKASALLKRAADLGQAKALYITANLYLTGNFGFKQDTKLAMILFERAVAAGDEDALATLGTMYCAGRVKPLNMRKGKAMLEEALSRGSIVAKRALSQGWLN